MQSNNAFEGSERVSSLRQSLALVGPTLSTICSGHLPWTMVDNPRMMTLDDDGDGRDCKRCTADITVAATGANRSEIGARKRCCVPNSIKRHFCAQHHHCASTASPFLCAVKVD